ncbi:MAG: hypothetical protein ACP5PZ_04105 [Bacteroidales bacterium]
MKNKKLPVLIILCLLCVLIAINLIKNRNSTLSSHDAQLTLRDSTVVHHMLVRRTNDSLYISRQTNETWIFTDKRIANPAYLKFCFRIFSQLKISSVVPKNQWNSIGDSIVHNGVEIVLYDQHHQVVQDIFLLSDRQNQKTYALRKSGKQPFLVELPGYEGNFSGIFYLPITHWYQPLIIHYHPAQIREVHVEHTESPSKSFTLRKLPGQLPVLLDIENEPHPYSEEAVKAYLTFLRNISVDRYLDKPSLYDSLQHAHPIYRILIVDQSDSLNQLSFYPIRQQNRVDKNFCYVTVPNGLVGIIPYYRLDPVARPIDFFTSFGE